MGRFRDLEQKYQQEVVECITAYFCSQTSILIKLGTEKQPNLWLYLCNITCPIVVLNVMKAEVAITRLTYRKRFPKYYI